MSSEAGSEEGLLFSTWSLVCLLWGNKPRVTCLTSKGGCYLGCPPTWTSHGASKPRCHLTATHQKKQAKTTQLSSFTRETKR